MGLSIYDLGGTSIFGGHLLPPSDNAYDLGSAARSWRNAHFQTAIYATSVVGNWSPGADDTYDLGIVGKEWKDLRIDGVAYIDALTMHGNITMPDAGAINTGIADDDYFTIGTDDTGVGIAEVARAQGGADPYIRIGRDDTGVAVGAVTDMLVLQAGAGGAVSNNFGLGVSFILGNDQAAEVEERASLDIVMTDVTNGSEDAKLILNLMVAGSMSAVLDISNDGTKTTLMGLSGDYWRIGDAGTTAHSLNSEDDLMVTGAFEVKGQVYFDSHFNFATDAYISFRGGGARPLLLHEAADIDAQTLILVLENGGGTYVPVFIIGDVGIYNVDLGFFDGIAEPNVALINDACDAYVCLSAGDVNGGNGNEGLYFKAAADEDINILKLSVGGTPTLIWDESEDRLAFSHGINVGGAATGLKFTGTYTSHVLDFSSVTQGAGDISLIRAGSYGSPMDAAGEAQYGMMRLYLSTDDDGTSYNRGVFVCLKTAGTKGIFPIAGLAEVLAQSGNGPTAVMAAQFIADLHTTDAKLAALSGVGGMYGVWAKITAIDGATIHANARAAPIWLDNQLYGANAAAIGEEYTIFSTTGGSVPKAWAGFETSGAGWNNLFYFDETAYDEVPISGSGLKVLLNTTQKYIYLMDSATQQTGTAVVTENYAGTGDLDTEAELATAINANGAAINLIRTALNTLGLTTTV